MKQAKSLSGGPSSPSKTYPSTSPSTPLAGPVKRKAPQASGVLIDDANMIQAKPPGRETVSKNSKAWHKLIERWNRTDAGHLRGYLHRAGIRIANMQEPTTYPRLHQLLRRVGVSGADITKSVGLVSEGFKTTVPNLPLWAAFALVLESLSEATGRFRPQGNRAANPSGCALEHSR